LNYKVKKVSVIEALIANKDTIFFCADIHYREMVVSVFNSLL